MTFDQIAILALLLSMFIAYALERFRIELVALSGLAAAFLLGLVPVTGVFAGFSNAAVVTVVEILMVVSVLSRTRAVEAFAESIAGRVTDERAVLAILCTAGAGVSVFMNNIGALALMFPVTLSICTRQGLSPARLLMPLSFATLLGGLCSLTGTPANLIVNDWRIAETGGRFGYFALGSVGAPVALAGIAWLAFVAPRLFRHRTLETLGQGDGEGFAVELRVTPKSSLVGLSLTDLARAHDVQVHGVIRDDARRRSPASLARSSSISRSTMRRRPAMRSPSCRRVHACSPTIRPVGTQHDRRRPPYRPAAVQAGA